MYKGDPVLFEYQGELAIVVESNQPLWQKWSSSDFRPKERFDAWQEALNQSHLPWSISTYSTADFSGGIEMGRLHELQIVRCYCEPCSGFRSSRELAVDNDPYYGLLLIYEGHEEVEIGSNRVLLGPGNTMLWDSTMHMRFKLHSPVNKITVLVPQSRLHNLLPQSACLVGKAVDWRQGLGAVTYSHIASLVSETAHIDQQQSRPMAEITLELITTSLGLLQPAVKNASQADLLANIKQYIENNLDNPELGPRSIAEYFSISLRYLHLLFGEEEATVSRWILGRRLERCCYELTTVNRNKKITEVALGWGFNDSAHFSRAFKKKYGLAPREYRRLNNS